MFVQNLISLMYSLPPEVMSLLSLVCCYIFITLMLRFFNVSGLYVYNVIAMVVCNMQVLRAADFVGYSEPVALGTIVYSSSFLASDALTEFFGNKAAQRSIYISFMAALMVMVLMIVCVGHRPIDSDDQMYGHFLQAHEALSIIFTPNMAIVLASFIAYAVSQLTDIAIFSKLKELTSGGKIWLRAFCSIAVASFMDSVVFNITAWKFLAPFDVSWHSLFVNYIFGGYLLQLVVALFNVPMFYLLLKLINRDKLYSNV